MGATAIEERIAFELLDRLNVHVPMTHAHSRGAADLAELVALELGLGNAMIARCRLAALLHDVGMLDVQANIIVRPGPPSEADWRALAVHPAAGERLLLTIPSLASLAPIVRSHHECFDGSGYPGRLRGAAIPLEARLIAVVDAFDSMTTSVPFRRCFTATEALSELLGNSGSQFDPDIVEALTASFGRRARRLRLIASA